MRARTTRFAVGALVIAMLASVAGTGPAQAIKGDKGGISGVGLVSLNCNLHLWPAFTPESLDDDCSGEVAGVDWGFNRETKEPYFNYCNPVCMATVTGRYTETCIANEPLVGEAAGWVNLSDAEAVKSDLQSHTSQLSIPFHWFRVGVVAIVLTGKLTGSEINDVLKELPFWGLDDKKGDNKKKEFDDGSKKANDKIGGIAIGVLIPLEPEEIDCMNPSTDFPVQVIAADVQIK
ncbi:MAG TPA: hypothetical protein VGB83_08605 [Actinomycetota bacterium]